MEAFVKFPTVPYTYDTISWSPSSNLLVTTASLLHVMTPKLGSTSNSFNRSEIELPKTSARQRGDYLEEVELRPDPNVAEAFLCACWSPLGCGKLGGCLVLAITTKGRAVIYEPEESALAGQWTILHDFSKDIHKKVTRKKTPETFAEFEATEIVSCAWSAPYHIARGQNPISIISLGTRAGTILFWKFVQQQPPSFIGSIKVKEPSWITKLSWFSAWENGISSLVAVGSNGAAEVFEVSLNDTPGNTQFDERKRYSMCVADDRLPTATRWHAGKRKVAMTKGNQLHVGSLDSNGFTTSMLSVPSFPPIIGLDWAYEGDELEIITLDGVVYDVAVSDEGLEVKENRTTDLYNGLIKHGAFEPVADDEQGGAEESQRPATTNAGAPQVVVPPAAIISKDTDKTTVLRPYPTQARVYGLCKTRFGLLEAVHLGLASLVDVEFLIATRTVSYVLFMPRGSTTRDLLKLLRQDLDDPSLFDKVSSITLSLDALMYVMTDRTQVAGQAPQDTAFARTLAALAPSQQMPSNPGHPSVFAQNANPIYEGPKPSVELQIDSLRTYWYTNPEVNRVRVINTILATAKAFDPSASMAIQNNSTLMHIHHILGLVRCVERLLTLVGDLSGTLTPRSIHAIMTICDYVLLNSALFPVLLGSVKGICQRLMPAIGAEPNLAGFDLGPELAAAQALIDGAGTAPALPMRERCPACDDLFQVQSPWQAVCHNGHEWERCSVTIAVVDTPYARICVGCNRRTLLPGYFEEGKDRAGPSILSELLRGYDQCLYCGERLSLTLKMPS